MSKFIAYYITFTAILIFYSLSAFATKSNECIQDHTEVYTAAGITVIMIMRSTFSPFHHIVNCHVVWRSWEMKLVVSMVVFNFSDTYSTKLQTQYFLFSITSVMFSES